MAWPVAMHIAQLAPAGNAGHSNIGGWLLRQPLCGLVQATMAAASVANKTSWLLQRMWSMCRRLLQPRLLLGLGN
jgi:hypothetical protein